jgi:sRNA-binding protein
MSKKHLDPGAGNAEVQETSLTTDGSFSTQAASNSPAAPTAKARSYAEVKAVLELLQEQWPKTISIYQANRRPLKVGIFEDILKELDGVVTADELRNALRAYTANQFYLKAIKVGASRIDLDGKPSGVIDKDEAEHAVMKLKHVKYEEDRKKIDERIARGLKP